MTGDELRARIDRLGLSYVAASLKLGLTISGLHHQMRGERAVTRQTEMLLEQLERDFMVQINEEWSAAPKDGSPINVQFPDGTKAKAWWNVRTGQWQVLLKSGRWKSMRSQHGSREPIAWWL